MPRLCPKCGSYDPTPEITSTSRCPACGVVYAKLAPDSGAAGTVAEVNEPAAEDWALPDARFFASLAAVALLLLAIALSERGFVLVLDHANLAFHEAGHLFFGFLGSTLGLYGGTLGQLVFPVVVAVICRQRRDAAGVALAGVWFFENFLNIARYMADARTRLLPLVGGGEHDWYHIFSRWGVLNADTRIAGFIEALGWIGMLACVFWLWRLRRLQDAGS